MFVFNDLSLTSQVDKELFFSKMSNYPFCKSASSNFFILAYIMENWEDYYYKLLCFKLIFQNLILSSFPAETNYCLLFFLKNNRVFTLSEWPVNLLTSLPNLISSR